MPGQGLTYDEVLSETVVSPPLEYRAWGTGTRIHEGVKEQNAADMHEGGLSQSTLQQGCRVQGSRVWDCYESRSIMKNAA